MALCEFGCSNLDEVYNMTWCEFRIRQYGYNRMQEREWYKVREVAFASIIGSHLDPKKLPTKEKFMPLGKSKDLVSEKMRETMKNAILQYNKEKDGKS